MKISQDLIAKIKDELNIESVAEELGIKINKSRRVALCPFHNDKNPSMSFKFDRYRCFSCNEYGDIFDLVQKLNGLTFHESIEYLANKAGIDIPKDNFSKEDSKQASIIKNSRECLDSVFSLCEKDLLLNKSNNAFNYLSDRGISKRSIIDFRLGYSKSYNIVSSNAFKFGLDVLKFAGLDSYAAEAFNNRIVIPIFDDRNRPLGFSCRTMSSVKVNKYINTRTTGLFNKSKVLFGINIAKSYILNYKHAFLAEGQFDVIKMHDKGIKNTVAIQGSALTQDHINVLKSLGVNKVTLMFDGDQGGFDLTIKSIYSMLLNEVSVYVFPMPKGSDPDSYFSELSSEENIEEVIRNKSYDGVLVYLYKIILDQYKEESLDKLNVYSIEDLLLFNKFSSIKYKNNIVKQINIFCEDTKISKEYINNIIQNSMLKKALNLGSSTVKRKMIKKENQHYNESFLTFIYLVIAYPEAFNYVKQYINDFGDFIECSIGKEETELWNVILNKIKDKDALFMSDIRYEASTDNNLLSLIDTIQDLDIRKQINQNSQSPLTLIQCYVQDLSIAC